MTTRNGRATELAVGAATSGGRFCTGFADREDTRAADLLVRLGLAVPVEDDDVNAYRLTDRGMELAARRS